MLKSATESGTAPRPEINQLFERLQSDGRRWAEAESELAKIELAELKGKAIRVAVFGILAFVATLCALFILSQAAVAFLTPYVDSIGVAALIVGGVLLLLVGLSIVVIRSALTWETESIFFRWLSPRAAART